MLSEQITCSRADVCFYWQGLVKLADFGVAAKLTEVEDDNDSLRMSVVGTPYWMAPEVIEMTSVTAASDIWSVACLAIELLTGQPPYYDLQPMSALFRIVQVGASASYHRDQKGRFGFQPCLLIMSAIEQGQQLIVHTNAGRETDAPGGHFGGFHRLLGPVLPEGSTAAAQCTPAAQAPLDQLQPADAAHVVEPHAGHQGTRGQDRRPCQRLHCGGANAAGGQRCRSYSTVLVTCQHRNWGGTILNGGQLWLGPLRPDGRVMLFSGRSG